jgi:hypothetical protein
MKKYTKNQIESMRAALAENAAESILNGDFNISNIVFAGFVGYNQRPDEDIIAEYESSYGSDLVENDE